ncbi:hypothetical protein C8R43DRAFT_1126375 [Mycena crocata]|nr:hypothetical protein C8R43DRAFT_1126375 [Mycena crocata]
MSPKVLPLKGQHSKSASVAEPSERPAGTLYDFYKSVKAEPVRRPRRCLTARVPAPRMHPLRGGKSNPPIVDSIYGAADADRLRRHRPRNVAIVHPTGAHVNRTVLAVPGRRMDRVVPLTVEDLWDSPRGPPHIADVDEDFKCTICLQVKSHPVSYLCGHSHCYSCIRIWLEEQWDCPECRAIMTVKPFRVFAEEGHIRRRYGDWDTSVVSYSWFGLIFPVLPTRDEGPVTVIAIVTPHPFPLAVMYSLCPDGSLTPELLKSVMQGHGRHSFATAALGIDFALPLPGARDNCCMTIPVQGVKSEPYRFILFGQIACEPDTFRGWPGRLVVSLASPNWNALSWDIFALEDEFTFQIYSMRHLSHLDRQADIAAGKTTDVSDCTQNGIIKLEVRPSSLPEYVASMPPVMYRSDGDTAETVGFPFKKYSFVVKRMKRVNAAYPDEAASPGSSDTLYT